MVADSGAERGMPDALPPPSGPVGTSNYATAARAYADARGDRVVRSAAVQHGRWPRAAVITGLLIGLAGNVAVALTQVLPSKPETSIALGIVFVVLLGAGGLAVRGVGELRDSPGWKASGCFLCAAAYVATATVALANGVPLIFHS